MDESLLATQRAQMIEMEVAMFYSLFIFYSDYHEEKIVSIDSKLAKI